MPYLQGSPLRSQVTPTELHYDFQDFEYIIDSMESIIFTFASTSDNEVVGIDSVTIVGTPRGDSDGGGDCDGEDLKIFTKSYGAN